MENYIERYAVETPYRYLHYLPNTFRCLINGQSGSGKTNLLLNILSQLFESYKNNKLKFKLEICSKTLNQPLYEGFIKETKSNYKEDCSIETSDRVSHFNEEFYKNLNKDIKHVIVIDDMVGQLNKDDRKALIHLFTASRPRGISLFFLTQRYTQLEIVCRQQINYLITFKQGFNDLRTIYSEHLNFMENFSILENKFKTSINYYCLFCDLEKSVIKDCVDIFEGSKEINYYSNVNDLIEKMVIIDGEINAGNDNDDMINEIRSIINELVKMDIISV